MLNIFVDADACPVKQEIYRVAGRYGLNVTLVANAWMRIPDKKQITLKIVGGELDAADDWIIEQIQPDDIVITGDIPLASRCLQKGAQVLGPAGKVFTENNIGQAVATRNLLSELREAGQITGGPPPVTKKDRSSFLQKLNEIIQLINHKNSKKAGQDKVQ